MSLNDKDITLKPAASNDVWPGSANPTSQNMGGDTKAANFMNDPTTEDTGAGAPADFEGHKMAKKAIYAEAGVVEARPGIIDSTNIDPLNENSNKDDGWANATDPPGTSAAKSSTTTNTTGSIVDSATSMATGAAKYAYGTATGNTTMAEEGKASVTGAGPFSYGTTSENTTMAEEGKKPVA